MKKILRNFSNNEYCNMPRVFYTHKKPIHSLKSKTVRICPNEIRVVVSPCHFHVSKPTVTRVGYTKYYYYHG